MVSSEARKCLIFNEVPFFVLFCFIIHKEPKSEIFTPMFSSKSFIDLVSPLMSLVHFELIVVYDVKWGSNFFLFHVYTQLTQCYLLKKLLFSIEKFSCQKSIDQGFPGGVVVENLPANAGHTGSSPGLGRSHMPQSNWARDHNC